MSKYADINIRINDTTKLMKKQYEQEANFMIFNAVILDLLVKICYNNLHILTLKG